MKVVQVLIAGTVKSKIIKGKAALATQEIELRIQSCKARVKLLKAELELAQSSGKLAAEERLKEALSNIATVKNHSADREAYLRDVKSKLEILNEADFDTEFRQEEINNLEGEIKIFKEMLEFFTPDQEWEKLDEKNV